MPIDPSALRDRIEHADNLPTLSIITSQIAWLVSSPTTSAADIGRLIESDQALTANVLKLVNSAYFGFPQRIRNIQHAVVILGFSKVKNVVLTASVIDATRGASTGGLNLRRLWQHAMGAAIAAKVVADLMNGPVHAEDAFIAGLLHDLGKFILAVVAAEEYAPVLAAAHGRLLVDAERDMLGFTHSDAGQWLADKWRLPEHIRDTIGHHHLPAAARANQGVIAIVHLGDIITRALGIGNGGDNRIPAIAPEVIEQYRIGTRFLDVALQRSMADLERASDFFKLMET